MLFHPRTSGRRTKNHPHRNSSTQSCGQHAIAREKAPRPRKFIQGPPFRCAVVSRKGSTLSHNFLQTLNIHPISLTHSPISHQSKRPMKRTIIKWPVSTQLRIAIVQLICIAKLPRLLSYAALRRSPGTTVAQPTGLTPSDPRLYFLFV